MFTWSVHIYTRSHTHNQCFAFMATQTVNELWNHNYIASCFPDGTFPALPSCMSKPSLPLPPRTHLSFSSIHILEKMVREERECIPLSLLCYPNIPEIYGACYHDMSSLLGNIMGSATMCQLHKQYVFYTAGVYKMLLLLWIWSGKMKHKTKPNHIFYVHRHEIKPHHSPVL